MAEVEVVLAHPWNGHAVNDRVSVTDQEALDLIRAGYAVPATKPNATKLGVDPETAKTAKK